MSCEKEIKHFLDFTGLFQEKIDECIFSLIFNVCLIIIMYSFQQKSQSCDMSKWLACVKPIRFVTKNKQWFGSLEVSMPNW